jgi:uncharacterized protein (TIGR02145 family)
MMKKIGQLLILGLALSFVGADSAWADPSSTIDIEVKTTLSLSLSQTLVNFNLSSGSFMTRNISITGMTNSPAGYSISVRPTGETAGLKHNSASVSAVIPALNEPVAVADFPGSGWGYSGEDTVTTYNPFSTENTNVFVTNENGQATHKFTIGISVGDELPAGVYSNELMFTMVGNIPPEPEPAGTQGGSINEPGGSNAGRVYPANSLERAFEIAYVKARKPVYIEDSSATLGWRPMTDADDASDKEIRFAIQDIDLTFEENDTTKDVCAWVTEGTEAELLDLRDGRSYWVAKLQDGHCWMTQNLDYNIVAGVPITSETTNLKQFGVGAYTTENGYAQDAATGVISWTPASGAGTIDAQAAAAGNSYGFITGWAGSYYVPASADPGDWYWKSQPFYQSSVCDTASCNYLAKSNELYATYFAETPSAATNNKHGHVGNYYNWTAAIATNDSTVYDAATNIIDNPGNSICPKGWRLPIGSNITTGENMNEFTRLINLYNGGLTTSSESIEGAPLYVVRAGGIGSGRLYSAGNNGQYWSSTLSSGSHVYELFFTSGRVAASDSTRDFGYSVRCVSE